MKENQNWIVWNPTNIEFGTVYAYAVEALHCEDGIKFVVDCEKNKMEVVFSGFVPAYTYSLEGMRLASWGPVQKKYNDKYFFTKWFLYKIENSSFLKWGIKESCGFYSEAELTHYCIVTEQSLMDILATSQPQIIINPNNS